jgi:uncharacterized protein YecE (DUF72 family)
VRAKALRDHDRDGEVFLGTSGYAYAHWRRPFYEDIPPSGWLAHYATTFRALEVNATFYRLQSAETFARWAATTPRGFRFACKGSRFLTHMKRLLVAEEGLDRFFGPLASLGRKLGPVLWQLPPQMMRADPERLDRFLTACRGRLPHRIVHAVEFRSAGWYVEEICDVLDRHRAAFCEHDLVDARPPRLTGGFRYLRFHGAAAKYRGRYGIEALRPVARDLLRWTARGHDAWVFFNNDEAGHALQDARALGGLLGGDTALPTSACGRHSGAAPDAKARSGH